MKNSRGSMSRRKHCVAYEGPSVMVLHEHHRIRYMDAMTEEALLRSALRVLKGRLTLTNMYFFSEEERLEAERIVTKKDGSAAWDILRTRNTYENEKIDLEKIETKYLQNNGEDE